jgi:hypothetical protein
MRSPAIDARRFVLLCGVPLLACSDVSGVPAGAGPTCTVATSGADDDDAGAGGDDDDGGGGNVCQPGDSDGVVGGCYAFEVRVDETGFTPAILKAQNRGEVTLKLTNAGKMPHDFVVGCIPTGQLNGCPPETCFPSDSAVSSVPAGSSATVTFVTPNPEGIYTFRSDVAGDSQVGDDGGASGLTGQFILQ